MAYGQLISALADPTRRAVFESLRTGPQSVGDIADHFPVSRPAISQHLRVLKHAGLVSDRRQGTRVLYGVNPEALAELRRYVDSFWQDILEAFNEHTRAAPRRRRRR